jgi:ribosomal protein S18 acetylase RimI-like enzyme
MIVRPATAADLPAVDRVFRTSFCDTFAHLYAPEDLAAFLGGFTSQGWATELADPRFAFQVGEVDRELLGYAKLGPNKLPHIDPDGVLELKQLYLLRPAHGTGMAQALMNWTLDEARRRGAKRLALSVWSENWRAQSFYRRFGFIDRGPVTFMVGNHPDEDRVWETSL